MKTRPAVYWKHIGLYAYRRTDARCLRPGSQPGVLEQTERLEQLRLLENGISLYVEPTEIDTVGVDTHEDLRAVEAHPTVAVIRPRSENSAPESAPSTVAVGNAIKSAPP